MHDGSCLVIEEQESENTVKKTSSISDISHIEYWVPRLSRKKSDIANKQSEIQPHDSNIHIGKGLSAARHVMFIRTDDNGYNSGRKYYLQTNTDANRREIVDSIAARSKAARIRKEAKGKLQRVRERVGALIKSNPFQYFFAVLIALVRIC